MVSSPITRYASASRAASSAAGKADSSSAEGIPGTSGTTGNDHHSGQLVNNPPRRVASPDGQLSRPVDGSRTDPAVIGAYCYAAAHPDANYGPAGDRPCPT